MEFNTIKEALEEIKKGKMVIAVDDERRENEGDFIMAAEKVTPEAINFMAKYGRGLICVPCGSEIVNRLDLTPMVVENTDNHMTAFTVPVDAEDTTTGISAHDRSLTISRIVDETSSPGDFRRPGHIFPLQARDNGVLERQGHTEAAVDLSVLSGLKPAGVICEIMNEDGTMARRDQLKAMAEKYCLKIITIADLISYRKDTEVIMKRITETKLPTEYGEFRALGYLNITTGEEHVALIKGEIETEAPVLVRLHSECLTGDAFGSKRCDCGEQYAEAMRRIAREGSGILIYLRQEGRGIGLLNKLKAYSLQDRGLDTVEANIELGFPPDLRDYRQGTDILKDLGVRKVRLMTNNPEKIRGIQDSGIEVSERVDLSVPCSSENEFYLKTKQHRMGHLLNY